jgi:hypothetical protein
MIVFNEDKHALNEAALDIPKILTTEVKYWDSIPLKIKEDFIYPYEDGRLSADKVNLPNGFYDGLRAAYTIKLNNGIEIKTIWGIRCSWRHPIKIKIQVRNGIVYTAD